MINLFPDFSNEERIQNLKDEILIYKNKINNLVANNLVGKPDLDMHNKFQILDEQQRYFEKELAYREAEYKSKQRL